MIIIIKLINKIIRNKLWLYNEQTTLDGKPKPLAKTYAKWVELTDGMAQQVDIILIITIIIVIINIIASKLTASKKHHPHHQIGPGPNYLGPN